MSFMIRATAGATTRQDLIEWIAGEIPTHYAVLSSGDPWDAAWCAFKTVIGRPPCERWGAVTPSPGAEIEDALCCWDVALSVDAMLAAGFTQEQIDCG